MDTQRAFLADVVAHPGDDTPWLVLSDWLEDHGETFRAELVRLSVWLRRHPGDAERPSRERRLRQLYDLGLTVPLPRRRLAVGPDTEMDLVFIPPGRFLMGSPPTEARRDPDEGPVHPVALTRGFWLGVNPVTRGQWLSLLGSHPPGRPAGRLLPVEGVSWLDCQEFVEALRRQHGLPFRLPTEAEWEFACRALTTTPFFFGPSLSSRQANFDGNYPSGTAAVGPWNEQASAVASYPPNGFGLFDMHGNVWEWCADWYDETYYAVSPEVDPPGPAAGSLRVIRGGSWFSYSWSCRSAGRERFAPESGAGNYGLRVALGV